LIDANRVSCDFVQVLLINKSDDIKFEESLQNIPSLLSELINDGACDVFDARRKILKGEKVADAEIAAEAQRMIDDETQANSDLSPQLSGRISSFYVAIEKICNEQTEESAREFLVLSHEAGAETCEPFFNKYNQIFVRVDANLWVVESTPSGTCGIVNTSRLYGDPKYPSLWSYEASKIVTNKDGVGIVPCSEMDERPQTYSWNQPQVYKNCRFLD
jgi:hypothetical protein